MAADEGLGGQRVVGDYVLERSVGRGSYAEVWRAAHRETGEVVAIKEIDKKQVNEKVRDGLFKEIAILRRVSHPNIVRFHEAIQEEDKLFLVLEYCAGGDLTDYIKRYGNRGRVSEAIVRHFMRHLAEGLKVLRENNLIHRDLKPQNLLLSTDDETPILKIGDFGFARYLMPQGLADTLCGSPLYMAPEIMQDRKYDAKADLWSVGAILFQIVTGKVPFDGKTHFQLFQNIMASDDIDFPPEVLLDVHPDCIDLCRGLLRRIPVQRLAFEEFFRHKFMEATSITRSAPESQNRVGLNDGVPTTSSDVLNVTAQSMVAGHSCTKYSQASDSFDSIEREYVLVHANFASMEMLSSSFERSMNDDSTTRVASCSQIVSKVPFPTRARNSGCEVASRISASLSASRESTTTGDVQGTSYHLFSRLQLLNQYINALTELAQEKLSAGLHLDSFSIELVILAIWKEALNICSSWVAPTTNSDIFATSAYGKTYRQTDHLPVNIREVSSLTKPLSVFSWAEQGFIDAYDRAEDTSNRLQENNDNGEMPDAMEVIFQAALNAGKDGAVDELMGHRKRAVALYSKAILYLTFIITEATSLPLNPPFSLSPSNQHRIEKYILNLKTHLDNPQMAEIQPRESR